MPRARFSFAALAVVLTGVVAGGAATTAAPSPAAAYPSSEVDLAGRGWGHGRGMGQWGSLGYAVDSGWTYSQILEHFYGGTTKGTLPPDHPISVRLTSRDSLDTIVVQERGKLRTSPVSTVTCTPGAPCAARVERVGPSSYRVYQGTNCGGPWTPLPQLIASPSVAIVATAGRTEDRQDMLQVCEATGARWVRGDIHAAESGGGQYTVNHLRMEDYLRGVVPRESPASWGDVGGGKGMHALRAQAVAARSYAEAENRGQVAKTCDTISCQVYKGRAEQVNGVFRDLEDPRTDRAIAETAGEIRLKDGRAARTEFSSSTGGHTAGGTFPPVVDDGDDYTSNPNHTWTVKVPVATIEAKYPDKGTLLSIDVTGRNGFGALGGRVLTMSLRFSGGAVALTGDGFRQSFGLKSNWFTVSNNPGDPYHALTRDGGVHSFNGAAFHGSLGTKGVRTPARDIAETQNGYWILTDDGNVHTFGDARSYGSPAASGLRLNRPPRQVVSTVSGKGYWIMAEDGGVFSYGDARFMGSTGAQKLNAPVVGIAPTPTGNGYWLVASDGGVFSFGDAKFFGSTGAMKLNRPVNGMAATTSGNGYWLLASDGGLFAFGDAGFHGSLPGRKVVQTAVDMQPARSGAGYFIATAEGDVYSFGAATAKGGPRTDGATSPTVALSLPR